MRSPHPFVLVVVLAVAAASLLAATAPTATASQAAADPVATGEYTVLVADGAEPAAAIAAVRSAGGHVVRENAAVGVLVVQAPAAGFVERVAAASGAVAGAARTRPIGTTSPFGPFGPRGSRGAQAWGRTGAEQVDRAAPDPTPAAVRGAGAESPGPSGLDPLDVKLWGLTMIKADAARKIQPGDRRVMVGVLDSGIDGTHPDLAPNFDAELSRNFVTDIPNDPTGAELDGPCEVESCVDPVDRDDSGHGTHVAGTIAAAANGIGLSGVAPNVTLVNIRGAQDAGLFFLQPVVDALTYGADIGLDVINMSFYVDPWLYNCIDNPVDSPEARIEQRTIIEAMSRALVYAHDKGVTLIGSLDNNNEDLGKPRPDRSSPDYPRGSEYVRPIDNDTCFNLPVEGPHVIGVSAVGPSGRRAEYSNYGLERVSLAAPGGSRRDLGVSAVADEILSTYPRNVLQAGGEVDEKGDVTPRGEAVGVQRVCTDTGCGYYAYLQGTSMAAPHASGVAALVVSQYGTPDPSHPQHLRMPPEQVEQALVESAAERACPVLPRLDAPCEGGESFNSYYGHGILDAAAAVGFFPR